MTPPPGLALAVLRLLLWLFPANNRLRFGPEIRQFVLDEHSEVLARGKKPGVSFWLRTYRGLVVNGLGARFEPLVSRMGQGSRPGPGVRFFAGGAGVAESFRVHRFTFRALVRSPGYTLTSLATLGLGIGACTVIFSVLYPTLVSPLPYPDSGRLVVVRERSPGPEGIGGWVSPLTFRDWRESTEVLEDMVSYRLAVMARTDGDSPALLRGWAVSAGFFPLMGVDLTLGRGFSQEEDRSGGDPVAVISHGFWARSFGSDPRILGRSITLDGVSRTIVGVAGAGLKFPSEGDYWVPLALDYSREFRDFRYLGVLGRIRPGAGIEEAQTELNRLAQLVEAENPDTNTGWGAEITRLREVEVAGVRPVLLGMAGAVALLLLIALGNVTNLTIARGTGRQTDTAIRKALGATDSAMARLVLSEALLLSSAGGALGIGFAFLGLEALSSTSLLVLPRVSAISLTLRGVSFGLTLALVAGLLLGGVALLSSRERGLTEALRAGGAGGMAPKRTQRLREGVLASQVALALTLLIGASLLTRSLASLGQVDPGFDPRGLMTFGYDLPSTSYSDPDALRAFEQRALEQLGAIPGVESVGLVTPIPLEMGSVPSSWSLSPEVREPGAGAVMAHMRTASPGYFPAIGLELLTGRLLEDGDRPEAEAVALVNQAFVRAFLSRVDPIGTRITWGEPDADPSEWATIVGIVRDVRFESLRVEGKPEIYLPTSQLPSSWGSLVVRSQLPKEVLVRTVQEAIRQVDSDLPLSDIKSGTEMIGGQLRTSRLSALLTSIFALSATVLAVVGILGVLSILVAQRMREVGLRIVLGAGTGSVWGFVLLRGMRPVLFGLGSGAALAAWMIRFLESQVFGVSPLDPLAFLLPLGGLALASAVACLVPGARAAAADPVSLLRSE